MLVGFVVKLGRKLQATGTKEYQVVHCVQPNTEFPKRNLIVNLKVSVITPRLINPLDSEKGVE